MFPPSTQCPPGIWPCTQRRDSQLPQISLFFFPFNIGLLARRPAYICLTSKAKRRDRHLGLLEESCVPSFRHSEAGEWDRGEGLGPQAHMAQNLLIPWYPEGWVPRAQVCPLGWTWLSVGPWATLATLKLPRCADESDLGGLCRPQRVGPVAGLICSGRSHREGNIQDKSWA